MKELFYTNEKTNLLIVVGNHDIGFHYDVTEKKLERFNRSFNTKFISFHQTTLKRNDIHFILVNSMSLENDGCSFCKKTQKELKKLNNTLKCLKGTKTSNCTNIFKFNTNSIYSRPIIFTHYPLYRDSDSICPLDIDSEKIVLNENPRFRPKYDCLSRESSKQVSILNPKKNFRGLFYGDFNIFDILRDL